MILCLGVILWIIHYELAKKYVKPEVLCSLISSITLFLMIGYFSYFYWYYKVTNSNDNTINNSTQISTEQIQKDDKYRYVEIAGQIGDSFGVLNSLLTAANLVIVITSLYYLMKEYSKSAIATRINSYTQLAQYHFEMEGRYSEDNLLKSRSKGRHFAYNDLVVYYTFILLYPHDGTSIKVKLKSLIDDHLQRCIMQIDYYNLYIPSGNVNVNIPNYQKDVFQNHLLTSAENQARIEVIINNVDLIVSNKGISIYDLTERNRIMKLIGDSINSCYDRIEMPVNNIINVRNLGYIFESIVKQGSERGYPNQ
jgi:hypothetical protein